MVLFSSRFSEFFLESIRCGANLRQSILLLQFLENLEKLMYSAFEGSAFSLPLSLRVSGVEQLTFTQLS